MECFGEELEVVLEAFDVGLLGVADLNFYEILSHVEIHDCAEYFLLLVRIPIFMIADVFGDCDFADFEERVVDLVRVLVILAQEVVDVLFFQQIIEELQLVVIVWEIVLSLAHPLANALDHLRVHVLLLVPLLDHRE